MKKGVLIAALLLTIFAARAVERDSLSIGLSGSLGNYDAMGGELYLGKLIKLFGRNAEIKMGLNYRPYNLSVDRVTGMEAVSGGAFGDLAIYPFSGAGLFVGLRWEAINFNRLSEGSVSKFEQERGHRPSQLYTGTCLFVQAGYRFRLSDAFALRAYGQPGMQQFRISSGGNNMFVDNQHRFIYNINLGIEIRIK